MSQNGRSFPRGSGNVTPFPYRPNSGGTGGPHDPGIEIRIAHLEENVREIKTILQGIDKRLRSIETGSSELRGRIQTLPTTWQMLTTVIGTQVTLVGLVYTVIRFASH